MKTIRYSDQALKFLRKLTHQDADRIRNKIKQYASAPETLSNQVKKLQGVPYYRLRVGNYRVIFNDNGEILYIEKIGNRGDVYKGV